MADIARVKTNVAKMVDAGAPESDIDAYIAGEGTTPEALRSTPVTAGGLAKAAGSGLVRGVTGAIESSVAQVPEAIVHGAGVLADAAGLQSADKLKNYKMTGVVDDALHKPENTAEG